VKFVDSIPERSTDALGLIKLQKNFRWSSKGHEVKYSGSIQIVRSIGGTRLSYEETRDVAMHELGHLLGLADAPRPGVIMGPLERGKPLSRPTQGEIDDVRALRNLLRNKISSTLRTWVA
jgi:hypothetical protein